MRQKCRAELNFLQTGKIWNYRIRFKFWISPDLSQNAVRQMRQRNACAALSDSAAPWHRARADCGVWSLGGMQSRLDTQVGRPTRMHWPRAGTEADVDGRSDNLLRYRGERYAVARIHRHRGRSLPRVLNGLPTEPSPIDALSTVFARSSCVVIVGARSVLSNTKV